MHGDRASGNWSIPGNVELSDPSLEVRGRGAQAATQSGTVEIEDTSFEIPARFGHGSASHIRLTDQGVVNLENVHYTTCPGPEPDWELKAGKLNIDSEAQNGTARDVQLYFKGVTIFPIPFVPVSFPYFSFPVGNERKSGVVDPSIGFSSTSGYQVAVPVYWNIAPNYDAIIAPTWYGDRGLDLGTKFRFLTYSSRGDISGNYLPDDRQTGEDRSFIEFHDQTDFTDQLRLTAEGSGVSDDQWLEDFGSGVQRTGVSVLPRFARLTYRGDQWSMAALVQNYQTVDPLILVSDRPYTLMPQLNFDGQFPDLWHNLGAELRGEYSNFRTSTYSSAIEGQRVDALAELRMPLRHNGVYVEPAAAWRFTAYEFETDNPIVDKNPTRSAPILTLDSGMVFERLSGHSQQRIQTIEPRLLYLYVPYRKQEWDIFDTTQPDFNLVQLFSTNRYVGPDRLGDANQIAMGVTTRLLDSGNGKQYMSATLGELYRFTTPKVTLPDEVISTASNSDLIGELRLGEYKNWNASIGLQWDPNDQVLQRTEINLQYIPGAGRVINAGYIYRKAAITQSNQISPDLDQVDVSAAWPVGRRINLFGRYVYSLEEQKQIDVLAGLEYRDCCWGFRFGMRQFRNQDGDLDYAWQWQVELNGLADVGTASDAFLSQSIRGYSAARYDRHSVP
jgi:LPS-assembly protein